MPPPEDRTAAVEESGTLLPLVLADDLTEGLVVIDRESVIRYVNPAMTRIFGYGRDELVGEPLTVLMPPDYRDRHREAVGSYLATGERHLPWSDVELPGRHRDGRRLRLGVSFTELTRGGERLFAGAIRDLTESGGPEAEQRLVARSYRVLFEEDVAAVFRAAPDGRLLDANGALAEMAGRDALGDLRGRDLTELWAEGAGRERLLGDLRGRREVRNRELRLRRAGGATLWTLVNAVWIDDPEEEGPAELIGTVVDISDRKRIERELGLAEQRYRRLFDQEVAGVYRSETGPDGRVIECNRAFADIFGYDSPAEVAGTPAAAFYPEGEDRRATVEAARRDGAVVKQEARLRRKDGSTAWGLAHARLVEDPEHGEIVEGLVLDVTERIRARRSLDRAKKKYETVFGVSPVAIAIADLDGNRFVEANPAFEELFGYDPGQLASEGVSPREVWADAGEREALVRELRDGTDVRNREVRFRRKDGTEWDALFSATISTIDGRAHLIGGAQDVTEQRRARDALQRAKEKFQGVFDISPVALAVLRPETDEHVEVNEAFEEMFGHDRGRVVGGPVTGADLWEDPNRRRRVVRRVQRGETVRNAEVRFRRRDGSVFDGLYSAAGIELEGRRLLIAAVQDVSQLKEVERELEHRSLHDRLTGLPNRALFWDRLEHALDRSRRRDERIAVLFVDLDGFKRINDEYGHAAGDEVLRRVAERLDAAVRDADTLARLGGDEFGVLLEDLDDESGAVRAAGRLTDQFGPPVRVVGEEALIRLSCGIALAGGGGREAGSVTADELVHRADRAMYVAKEQPGSSFRTYGPEIADESAPRIRRELNLKNALDAGDVVPHYQPLVDLADGRVVGAEALARWVHPERGLVMPGQFIPLAEETGLIVDLGRQITRSAFRDLVGWRDAGLLPPDFRLHLNLSARELDRSDVVGVLDGLFRDLDLDPDRVVFEVTETVAVDSARVLERIRELGPGVAIDDFGTQYATLERLTELAVDCLKLDRLFVSRIGESARHEAVLEASLTLAEAMGMRPVAEGVETEEQRAGLLDRGCRRAQGFLFGEAVPPEEFAGILAAERDGGGA